MKKLLLLLAFCGVSFAAPPAQAIYGWGTASPDNTTCGASNYGALYIETDVPQIWTCGTDGDWHAGSGSGTGTVSTGADQCFVIYSGAGTTVDDVQSTTCRMKWNATTHAVEYYDSSGTKTAELDTDTGVRTSYGTASADEITEIAAPGASSNAGKSNLYIDSTTHLLGTHTNGQSLKTYTAQGALNTKFYVHDTGGDDTYVVTTPTSGGACPTALADGLTVEFVADTTNTGFASLDFCGLGALEISAALAGTDLSNGDLVVGKPYLLRYYDTGTDLWIVTLPGTSGGGKDVIELPTAAYQTTSGVSQMWNFDTGATSDGQTWGAGYDFADATTSRVFVFFPITAKFTGTIDVTTRFVNHSGSAGNGVVTVKISCVGSAESLSSPTYNTTSQVAVAMTGGGGDTLYSKFSGVSVTNCAIGEMGILNVGRLGSDGSDTFTPAMHFIGAMVEEY